MPGVIGGHHSWEDHDSQFSGSEPYSLGQVMSPHRRDIDMRGAKSSYSNGYSSDQHSESNDDGPTYLLEHLATFSVGAQYGLETPKDGLRRLLQMEKSSGIWTQKMQMRLEKKWVVIIDYENGDVVERFPMSLISDPTCFTSTDPRELYNNILVFIVREDSKSKNHNPSEMHIFQCARVSAQEVVDEMKLFMSGKWKPGYRSDARGIPPPPMNPPPEPPANGINVREQVNMFNAAAAAAAAGGSPQGRGHQRMERGEQIQSASFTRESADETSSTSSEKYEKDVAILNHCFDDIERFIARLQHAAAAFRELERRRKNRKNKKKDLGDGMLSMRAKPPPEREFVDILQKFKLSFNLLAKLKNHIHDPNAPELVHFLFTPLAVIVDAARDSSYGPNLASKVVTPLLTRDAIELLSNCCTSKESDLWHSLGDSWIIAKEQWKGYEGSYHPVFSDGWAPEYPFTEERERAEVAAAAAATAAQRARRDEIRRAQEEAELREQEYHRVSSQQERDSRYDSEFYYGAERGGDRERSNSHQSAYDNRHYEPRNLDMSSRDAYLERSGVHTPSERDFRDHRERDLRSDYSTDSVEHMGQPLEPQRQYERQQRQWLEELKSRGTKIVQVMYPRTANNDKELTVTRGEYLEVLDDSRKWWKARNSRGQMAHVPHTIIAPFQGSTTEEDVFDNPLYAARGSRDNYYSPSNSPVLRERTEGSSVTASMPPHRPPPVPPPAPAPAPADWVRRERQGKKENSTNNPCPPDKNLHPSPQLLHKTPNDRAPQHSSPLPKKGSDVLDAGSSHFPRVASTSKDRSPKSNRRQSDDAHNKLHQELKERMTLGPKSQKKWRVYGSASGAYITANSSVPEVMQWLEAKEFSSRTLHVLKDLDGKGIFQLTKEQCEKYLGTEEGSRLHSNLLVQKNVCGYKTYTGQELQAILNQRRKKVETGDKPAAETDHRVDGVLNDEFHMPAKPADLDGSSLRVQERPQRKKLADQRGSSEEGGGE